MTFIISSKNFNWWVFWYFDNKFNFSRVNYFNVSKADIDNYITLVISNKINEFGKKTWHQDFAEQDYSVTSNAIAGNYQVPKDVIITIVGKNQLQDTIELPIRIKCYNQCANEKVFKSSDFDVNNLNSIALYPNVLAKRIIYPITFKDDSDALIFFTI